MRQAVVREGGSPVVPASATRRMRAAGPARGPDHAAEVCPAEGRRLVGDHVGLDAAEGGVRLVLDAVVEGLDDVLLEVRRAGEGRDDRLARGSLRAFCTDNPTSLVQGAERMWLSRPVRAWEGRR
jgi:hypothetical protein